VAIGADLIPRSARNDPHLAGVDHWELVSRGLNDTVRAVGITRLTKLHDDLPGHLKARADAISRELVRAGCVELGRWATDVLLAYARVPHLSENTQVAMYHAWTLAAQALSERQDVA
jgi:hypothetical protein